MWCSRKEQAAVCMGYLVLTGLEQWTNVGQNGMFPICYLLFFFGIVKSHTGSVGKKRKGEVFAELAFYGAFVCMVAQLMAGLFGNGFYISSYDKSVTGMLTNGFRVFPPLLARELVRGILFAGAKRQRKNWKKWSYLYLVAVVFTFLQINIMKVLALGGKEEIGKEMFQSILPLFMEQIFLNVLVVYGGWQTAFLYTGMLQAFIWFFPIVPDMNWLVETVIKLLVPAVFSMLAADKGEQIYGDRRKKQESLGIGSGVVLIFCVLLIWFFIGVFPIYPSVVMTGSMEPWIHPGDFVLIEKIKSQEELMKLKKGDVIHFKRDDIYISHRIVNILEDENGNRVFQTKGDNNSSEDVRLVTLKEVKGIVRYSIPKMGLPVLWLKGGGEQPAGVEF